MTGVLIRRGNLGTEEENVKTQEKTAIYLIMREASEEIISANTLSSDLQTQIVRRNKFILFKPPSLGQFVLAALTNYYTCIENPIRQSYKFCFQSQPYFKRPQGKNCCLQSPKYLSPLFFIPDGPDISGSLILSLGKKKVTSFWSHYFR